MGQNQLIGWNHYEDQKAQTDGLVFRDVRTAPFQIHGLYRPETEPAFHRLPDDVARATSEGVAGLQYNTAGGRVRFRTDSQRVAIAAVLPGLRLMPHMTLTGANGFDLYETVSGEAQYVHSFQPATDRYDALYARHKAMGCVCLENPAMGVYFIEDPDGYWIEIVPARE